VSNNLQRIRHARSCETKEAQPTPPGATASPTQNKAEKGEEAPSHIPESRAASIRWAARQGAVSAVASEKEIRELVSTGRLSESAAMNRDF
jgi:hypothetical protein